MSLKVKWFFTLAVLFVAPFAASAQLQTPAQFLGYELGARFTPHHRMIEYVRHVEANSGGRVKLQEYGKTNELRPLVVAYVSTPENIQNLETIRLNNLKRAGVQSGKPEGSEKAITWLSYNIHGNESNSMEASMLTLFTLVSGGMNTAEMLKDLVVIIDPCLNPDGRDRYANWYNQMLGASFNANPLAREHMEPWPGGRPNHYYFDLNRDWAWQIQIESQQRNTLMQSWLPHVHVDLHEMGPNNPYYFAPSAQPIHEDVTGWQREFQKLVGQNNAKYFDEQAWMYYTRETFDLLYPSYGDSYPTYQGAIAMTYEQAGGGGAGLGIWKREGDTLSLKDRLTHHFTASIATIEASAKNRDRLLDEFKKFYENGKSNPPGTYKAYVLKASNNVDKLAHLTSWLDRQGIQWGTAGKAASGKGFDYASGKEGNVSIAADDIVVSALQPKGILVKVLFEPKTRLADSLTYDITAWALPYVYGLDAVAYAGRIDPSEKKLPEVTKPAAIELPYAYIANWQSLEDIRFAGALLQAGFKIRYAETDFDIAGQRFARGSIIIPRTGHTFMGSGFDERVAALAKTHSRVLTPVKTGLAGSGPDLGSGAFNFMAAPRVLLISGEETSSLNMGELWHYFDADLKYPVTLVNSNALANADLTKFDVILMPSGSYNRLFNDAFNEKLKAWLQNGGKLIAIQGAVGTLARNEKLFGIKRVKSEDEKPITDAEKLLPYAGGERRSISNEVVGAIFKVQLDVTHPLSFGVKDYYTLRDGNNLFQFLEKGVNAGVLNKDSWRAGFVGAGVKAKQPNSLVIGMENVGRGSVIYFVDNPVFRGFWHNGKIMLANAIFLAGN
jgi:hypothetical protein